MATLKSRFYGYSNDNSFPDQQRQLQDELDDQGDFEGGADARDRAVAAKAASAKAGAGRGVPPTPSQTKAMIDALRSRK